jgi:hypothetical protein
MTTLNSDGEVEDIKTYKYAGLTYEMSKVVHTLMHDAATNIVRLSSRFGTRETSRVNDAWIHTLLSCLHNISI